MTNSARQTWIQRGESDRADDLHGAELLHADEMRDALAYHHDDDLSVLSADEREEAIAALIEGYGPPAVLN